VNVTAILRGTRDGIPLPALTLTPYNLALPAAVDRANLSASFNFSLPASWTRPGVVSMTAEINPGQGVPESNTGDNLISAQVTFVEKGPICLVVLPVRTAVSNYTVNSPGFPQIVKRFKSLWPVPQVKVWYQSSDIAEMEACFPWIICFGPYEIPDDNWKIMASLWTRAVFSDDPCDRTHYVGMVSPYADTGSQLGYGSVVSDEVWVKMDASPRAVPFAFPDGGFTLAEEIGHNYSWNHVDCPAGQPAAPNLNYPYATNTIGPSQSDAYYGFDFISHTVIGPAQAADFMAYCMPEWVSDYTWRGLFGQVPGGGEASLAAPEVKAVPGGGAAMDDLVILGAIGAGLSPIQVAIRVPQPVKPLLPRIIRASKLSRLQERQSAFTSGGGAYRLVLLSAAGAVLQTQDFTPVRMFGPDQPPSYFLVVPFDPNTAGISIRKGKAIVGGMKVSAHPPTVRVVTPNGGETIEGSLVIQVEASDPDGDSLTFTAEYSADNGSHWITLASGIPAAGFRVDDLSGIPGSSQARVRVIASDGINIAWDSSDAAFTLARHRPVPFILAPADGEVLRPRMPIALAGAGQDAEDGTIPGTGLRWTIDDVDLADGGEDVLIPGLPPGAHRIGLRVTDSDGLLATAEVTVTVGPPHGRQRPADVNGDGKLDISDAIGLLDYLFVGAQIHVLPCGNGMATDPSNLLLLDSNGDGQIDVSDGVRVLHALFLGGAPPRLGWGCRPIEDCADICR
jgi:hypothetical protein